MPKFHDVDCNTKADVESVVLDTMKTAMGGIDKQIVALTEMLLLHLAEHHKISYETCGIDGVTDIQSADAYVVKQRDQIWALRNTLKQEAEQFVKENNLA